MSTISCDPSLHCILSNVTISFFLLISYVYILAFLPETMADTVFKHDDDINTFLLLQLGQFQDAVKKSMAKAHNKLASAGCDATKKYDKARVDDEDVLLGMFLKLKQAEVRSFLPD
jgi:hypothetical protein